MCYHWKGLKGGGYPRPRLNHYRGWGSGEKRKKNPGGGKYIRKPTRPGCSHQKPCLVHGHRASTPWATTPLHWTTIIDHAILVLLLKIRVTKKTNVGSLKRQGHEMITPSQSLFQETNPFIGPLKQRVKIFRFNLLGTPYQASVAASQVRSQHPDK